MRLIRISLILGVLCATSAAEDYPFKIIDPTGAMITGSSKVAPYLQPLVEALKEPKEMSFIKAEGVGGSRKWSLQKITMITSELAAAVFTEGHIEVVGIYRRKFKPDRWDLIVEIDGVFSERSYRDPLRKENG